MRSQSSAPKNEPQSDRNGVQDAFNVVLPMLGAVVTDTGGMLSHPAIVAREFAIPGVVGCQNATDRIQSGDRIIVDGNDGPVRFAN